MVEWFDSVSHNGGSFKYFVFFPVPSRNRTIVDSHRTTLDHSPPSISTWRVLCDRVDFSLHPLRDVVTCGGVFGLPGCRLPGTFFCVASTTWALPSSLSV